MFLAFFNADGTHGPWSGESWNQAFIDVHDPAASLFYFRDFLAFYGFGPWTEGLVGEDFHEVAVGGIFSRPLGPLVIQLSAGAIVETGDPTYRLSVLGFF